MNLILLENDSNVSIPAHTEMVWCAQPSDEDPSETGEVNGFGLHVFTRRFSRNTSMKLSQLTATRILFNPSTEFKTCRDKQRYHSVSLRRHYVNLAFGSLLSPYQFQCAEARFFHRPQQRAEWSIDFAKHDLFIAISTGCSQFRLKREHIDTHRGVIIDIKSKTCFTLYVCLQNNLDEYVTHRRASGRPRRAEDLSRRFYLPDQCEKSWQPSFSAMRFYINARQYSSNAVEESLQYCIQFCNHHSVPIHLGSIAYLNTTYIYHHGWFRPGQTFIAQYAWQMLESVSCRMHDQMNNSRMKKYVLELITRHDDQLLYYIFERLRRLAIAPENYFLDLMKQLPDILHHYSRFYLDSVYRDMDENWPNYVRLPWFRFTPTRLIVKPFKFMRSNRVLRSFHNASDCMAFVEFRDDTGSEFFSKELIPLLDYYLRNGFHFAGRHYVHLHHAQSQIRNKQFYFYCEEEGDKTREELETWMGSFDDEKLPAKNTARRTQPFSSTESTIEIEEEMVDCIPDLKTEDKLYNFTDGVGQISFALNLEVHRALGVNVDENGYISSVLQIRYGGCKGTLAVNPLLDGKQKQLLIRPSMCKFQCEHRILEVCKRSLRRRLCLNREVINLLSYRGISAQYLLGYQLRNIMWLIASLVCNQSALDVLRDKVLRVLPWPAISSHPCLPKEPFFRRLLHTTIANNLHQLVTRAHIRVSQARYMFGVVDEYRVLQQEEVFVQITEEDGTKRVVEGSIAITKNPCRHPGDLLVLKAVDKERLRHLYDVLVFPQRGSRPHASEISGSDLDGDEYTVIWDPNLIPTSPNPSPYAYDSGPAPKPLERVVTREDRLKVILEICEQDNLGRLSNIHLRYVDKFGIDSDKAIDLAGRISQELDSVKSGQHPYTDNEIRELNSDMDNTRPDFMQTIGYDSYESVQILGQLYRSARHLTNAFCTSFTGQSDPIMPDPTLLHEGYKEYLGFARDLYARYQFEMLETIASHGFSNEIDLLCCNESRNMKANDRSDIQQTAQPFLKAIFHDIRQRFLESTSSLAERRAKAAACYHVAYNDRRAKNKQMLSFPWLFTSELLPDDAFDDEAEGANTLALNATLCNWLRSQSPKLAGSLRMGDALSITDLLDVCLEHATTDNDNQMIHCAEMLIEQIIAIARNTSATD